MLSKSGYLSVVLLRHAIGAPNLTLHRLFANSIIITFQVTLIEQSFQHIEVILGAKDFGNILSSNRITFAWHSNLSFLKSASLLILLHRGGLAA